LQVWGWYDWSTEKFESIKVMEAALQLADGIVRSLQNAMDKKHFSYLSDEGPALQDHIRHI
jgi:hypothetical protein